MNLGRARRIILIDDDIVFSRILEKVARLGNVELTIVNTLKKWDWRVYRDFDVAVIDYDLGAITGLQLVRSIENMGGAIPAILISTYSKLPTQHWPPSVLRFLHKSEGPQKILNTAVAADRGKTSILLNDHR